MTQRQKKFLEELPKNNYVVSRAAKKAGYTDNSARTNIYTAIHNTKSFKDFFTEDAFFETLRKLEAEIEVTQDYTNRLRLQELKSKILGLQIDKTQNQTELIVKSEERDEVSRLRGNILPVDN